MSEGMGERAAKRVERGWCQGFAARTKDGGTCGVDNPDAVSWCAFGALEVEASGDTPLERMDQAFKALHWLADNVGTRLILWNDEAGRTAAEVAEKLRMLPKENFP